ncbi:hypothetical protein OH491_16765 [Termitidicoccus mucosus]
MTYTEQITLRLFRNLSRSLAMLFIPLAFAALTGPFVAADYYIPNGAVNFENNAPNTYILESGFTVTGTSSAITLTGSYPMVTFVSHANSTVRGDKTGVELTYGGTVANAGTITGVGDYGIYSPDLPMTSMNVTTLNTGVIEGGKTGVYLGSGGVVNNFGLITGTSNGILFSNGGTVVNYGTIQGQYGFNLDADINGYNSSMSLINNANSSILGSYFGVHLNRSGTVVNYGLISGFYAGIQTYGAFVTNSGTIIGVRSGIRAYNYSNSLSSLNNNLTTSYIGGGDIGVYTNGGTVSNSGTIIGTGSYGIYGYDNYALSDATIINMGANSYIGGGDVGVYFEDLGSVDNQGLITGGTTGILLSSGGTVSNFGTITGTDGYGVHVVAGAASVTNNTWGTINGGVYAGGTTTVVNNGLITGALGVYLSKNSTLTGSGRIDASGTALALGGGASFTVGSSNEYKGGKVGISLENTATLTNSGTIIGTDVTGVETKTGSVLVTNNAGGLIQGGSSAVSLAAGGTVINPGTLRGTSGLSVGIYSNTAASFISNVGSGVIQGSMSGVYLNKGGTVSNSGTIKATDGYGVYVNGGGGQCHQQRWWHDRWRRLCGWHHNGRQQRPDHRRIGCVFEQKFHTDGQWQY